MRKMSKIEPGATMRYVTTRKCVDKIAVFFGENVEGWDEESIAEMVDILQDFHGELQRIES